MSHVNFLFVLCFLLRHAAAHDCYSCASSLHSAVADDELSDACKSSAGQSRVSTEPCCRDPWESSNAQQSATMAGCDLCLKMRVTWDDRDEDEHAFFRRMCYSRGDTNLATVLSTTVSGGDTIYVHKDLDDLQEEKQELAEMRAGVLEGECRSRSLTSPMGGVKMEVCGCTGHLCNTATATTPAATLLLGILVLVAAVMTGAAHAYH